MTASTWLIKDCNAFLPGRGFCPHVGIAIRQGKIADVGRDLKPARGATVFDAQGAWVTPGLIDGHTHLGMKDHPFDENDVNEKSVPLTPYANVLDAINPFNEVFAHAVLNGVTAVMALPGSTNILGGLGAVIKTYGAVIDRMTVRAPAAMKMALGSNPKNAYGAKGRGTPHSRMGNAYLMRKAFNDALAYRKRRKPGAKNPADPDIGNDNILQVLSGRLPARIHCHRADDIMTSLRIADEFGFKPCLDHVTEGYRLADELARRKIDCFVGPNFAPAVKQENVRKGYANAVKLRQAGVRIAIISDHGVDPCWFLPIYAGIAVREGLNEDDGLRAITEWPADMMGVQRRIGRLAKGLDADIAVWNRHPLYMGKAMRVWTAGNPADENALRESHAFRDL